MARNVKKTLCVLLSVLLLLPMNLVASAAGASQETQVQPRYSYTGMTAVSIAISSSGRASCLGDVEGYDGITTKIHIKLTLQKYTVLWWSKVETWEQTFTGTYGVLNPSTQLSSSGTYRVKAEFTVYSGSNSEEITSFSQERKYTKS